MSAKSIVALAGCLGVIAGASICWGIKGFGGSLIVVSVLWIIESADL